MTGFHGSKFGPVMDGLGVVETSIIVAIHFQCHGDGPLSIMKSLL